MQAGIGDVVAVGCRADSGDVTDMLDHSRKSKRHDRDDRRDSKARVKARPEDPEDRVIPLDGKTDPGSLLYGSKVNLSNGNRDKIGDDDADEDGDDLNHSLSPDVADNDNRNRDDGYEPIG